ncbi:sialate O-acetylesterase [Massilia sp. TS11]|uniref:sialate O-acetylesterase n=1 Tax=Massilia sp. TS11 TaxID=2908003 RepID=UPI001EDB2CB7|nr:sialate O-acetylesterase [Massilia sp. TS11]MCG2583943.1 sialate O-acetylesterase [Massilia sp. TS11]
MRYLVSVLCLLAALPAAAKVSLPAILSDHMVLQRGASVPVWGRADPGERISVRLGAQHAEVVADGAGRWRVTLDLRSAASAPGELLVEAASERLRIADVLVGEVWLASGQSNMEKPIGEHKGQKTVLNAPAEIAAADHPELRLFKVERNKASTPQEDVKGQWVRSSPSSIEAVKFSAAAYFFGRRLQDALHTPVGLIDSTWGGTRIELWTPPGLAQDSEAARLFNGMVSGLAPFAMKGVIWYQGESNIIDRDDGARYTAKMEALVQGWRQHWQQDFAFYYVQVAPHLYHVVRHDKITDPEAAPRLQEAQAAALRIPHTGMIVTTDLVDDLTDIHPRDKKSVGDRLATLALHGSYGRRGLHAYGPVFSGLRIEGSKAIVSFDHAEGLAARDRKSIKWFDLAGADGKYYPAEAEIDGEQIVLTSRQVAQPLKVRFGWDEAAQPNLVNGAGLPAMPFRSDGPAIAPLVRARLAESP